MPFGFKQLEQQFEERFLLEGETLLQADQVRSLRQVHSNQWELVVSQEYVRIKAGKISVQSVHCSCDTFSTRGACAHAVAGIMALRKHLQEELPAAQSIAGSKKKREVFSVEALLWQLPKEELQAFVHEYALRDKGFALALKARFLRPQASQNSKQHFQELLQDAVNASRSTRDQISAKGVQNLLALCRQLQMQAEGLLADGNFSESWIICEALFEQILPLHKKVQTKSRILQQFAFDLLKTLQVFLDYPIAPALKNRILLFSLQEIGKSVYSEAPFRATWLNMVIPHLSDPKHWQRLETMFTIWLQDEQIPSKKAPILLHLLQVRFRQSKERAISTCMELREQEELLFLAFDLAQEQQLIEMALLLGEFGLVRNPARGLQGALRQQLYELAQRHLGDSTWTRDLAASSFLVNGNADLLRYLQEAHAPHWEEKAATLLLLLDQLPGPRQIMVQGLIALSLGNYKAVEELLLQESMPFEQQIHFFPSLLSWNEAIASRLLETSIKIYLHHHLGPKAADSIETLLKQMEELGFNKYAQKLRSMLLKQFPERVALHERIQKS